MINEVLNRLAVLAGLNEEDVEIEESRGISDSTWDSYKMNEKRKYVKEHPTSRFALDPKYGFAKKSSKSQNLSKNSTYKALTDDQIFERIYKLKPNVLKGLLTSSGKVGRIANRIEKLEKLKRPTVKDAKKELKEEVNYINKKYGKTLNTLGLHIRNLVELQEGSTSVEIINSILEDESYKYHGSSEAKVSNKSKKIPKHIRKDLTIKKCKKLKDYL